VLNEVLNYTVDIGVYGQQIRVNYTRLLELTEGSGDVTEEDTVDCSKLILTEPYNGEDYSIVMKHRTSFTDLENIISTADIEQLNDESIFYLAPGNKKGKDN